MLAPIDASREHQKSSDLRPWRSLADRRRQIASCDCFKPPCQAIEMLSTWAARLCPVAMARCILDLMLLIRAGTSERSVRRSLAALGAASCGIAQAGGHRGMFLVDVRPGKRTMALMPQVVDARSAGDAAGSIGDGRGSFDFTVAVWHGFSRRADAEVAPAALKLPAIDMPTLPTLPVARVIVNRYIKRRPMRTRRISDVGQRTLLGGQEFGDFMPSGAAGLAREMSEGDSARAAEAALRRVQG